MKFISTLLVVAYPGLSYAAVWLKEPRLEWLALLTLICLPLIGPLAARRPWAWLLLPILAAGLYWGALSKLGPDFLYLSSLLIPGLLLWLFGSTLRAGQVPLITRMAARGGDPLTPEVVAYTRRLTELWTALFALMILTAGLLAVLGQRQLWSLVTNVLNYIVIGAFFVIEYLYRRWRFPNRKHPGFFAHLKSVSQFGVRGS